MLFDLTVIDERLRQHREGQPPSDFTIVYHLLSFERNADDVSEAVIQSAANVAWALHRSNAATTATYAIPDSNSMGAVLMGGLSLEDACQTVDSGHTLVVLENNILRRPDDTIAKAVRRAGLVVALDHLANRTTNYADALFPAATFAEGDGTFVNYEGRAQRFYQVFVPQHEVQESWRWMRDFAAALGKKLPWHSLDDVVAALVQEIPVFADLSRLAPPATARFVGSKIPRQPERYSGRTAMFANVTVHDPKPPDDPDSPLAFSDFIPGTCV